MDASSRPAWVPVPGTPTSPDGFFRLPPTVIGFDVYVDGGTIANNTVIDRQYESLGVVFRSAPDASIVTVTGGETTYGTDWISPPNTIATLGSTELWADFDPQIIGGYPQRAGVVFTDSAPQNPFTVEALGADGGVLDTHMIDTADTSAISTDRREDTFVGVVAAEGIRSLHFRVKKYLDRGIQGWEVDDVQFEPVTP